MKYKKKHFRANVNDEKWTLEFERKEGRGRNVKYEELHFPLPM